jgi:hypothetical protein
MKLRLSFAFSASILAVVACSGASSTELFGPAGSAQLGTDPAPPNDDGSSGAAGSSGSSGTSSSGGESSSGTSGSTSGGTSSGGTKDAGADTSTPPGGGSVACPATGPGAKTSCTPGTEICCGPTTGWGDPKFRCEAASLLACAAGMKIACDDSTDCPTGQVCCGSLRNNGGYTSVECKKTCENMPGLRAVRFCDPKAAVDECDALGQHCEPSQSLAGYHVCRD